MNRIIIEETDITSNELINIGSDVVYVPGFAVGGTQVARNPKLCTSISEFEDAFGESAPTFLVDQVYPLKLGTTPGFSVYAIPTASGQNRIWYNGGTFDPSYVYAKELIRAGLPVVYERVNNYTTKPSFENSVTLYSNMATYQAGTSPDYVVYDNCYYVCKVAITTPEEFTAAHWTKVAENGNTVEAFSTSKTYAVGDYCINSTKYYMCTTAITTAGAWNADNWEEVSDPSVVTYDVTVDRMYDVMMGNNLVTGENALYDENVPGSLSEISTYNIKYITSGGYPTFEYEQTTGSGQTETTVTIAQKMATLAATRGDAIAFIDHTDNAARPLTGTNSVYSVASTGFLSSATASFATMITPWAIYDTTTSANISLPGSFGYFVALARSLRTYPSWLPIAGVVRGLVPSIKNLDTTYTLTNAIADSYQTDVTIATNTASINAITYINDQGFTIWGNRTLSASSNNGFASTFLNMRNLICDVKKQAFKSAQRYMFEQNTDILWVNFKNDIQKLLDQMVTSSAVRRYKILKVTTTDKTRIAAKIQIVPIYAVETFEISIIMTDEEITVE